MLAKLAKRNREESFKRFATSKGGISFEFTDEYYLYRTKRGITHKYAYFNTFNKYQNSEYYPLYPERCNGFIFVEIK